MDAHDLALVHGGDPQRVAVAQVLLLREGQREEVLLREDLGDARLLETPPEVVARGHEALDLVVHELELGRADIHVSLLSIGDVLFRADKKGQVCLHAFVTSPQDF